METYFSNSDHTRRWLENFFGFYSDITICSRANGITSFDTDFDSCFRLFRSLKLGDVFCLSYTHDGKTITDYLMVDVDCLRPISYSLYFQLSSK